jgi:hypothetical protein
LATPAEVVFLLRVKPLDLQTALSARIEIKELFRTIANRLPQKKWRPVAAGHKAAAHSAVPAFAVIP